MVLVYVGIVDASTSWVWAGLVELGLAELGQWSGKRSLYGADTYGAGTYGAGITLIVLS